MPLLLLVAALAMPVVAWVSQAGTFGPDNATLSSRYPTLLLAAGYAFSVWGLIFLLDVVFAVREVLAPSGGLVRARRSAVAGFLLTAAWMPIFSLQIFWLALLVIWAAAACLIHAALLSSRDPAPLRHRAWSWLPLSLHAGWLSIAAFLNTAQVVVAYRILPIDRMLPWSLILFAAALGLLLLVNQRMRGNVAYVGVAIWGLVAVHVRQSGSATQGAVVAGWTALGMAALLAGQTIWLRTRAAS
jgi:hypothetical protein